MKHYAGLDVSVKETSICIVDEAGRICREMKVVSHPEDLLAVLCDPAWRLEREVVPLLLARLTGVIRQPVADFDLLDAGVAVALGAFPDFQHNLRRFEIAAHGAVDEHFNAEFLRACEPCLAALPIFDLGVKDLLDRLGERERLAFWASFRVISATRL